MSCEPDADRLKFNSFTSQINESFWHKFNEIKLDRLKLNDEPVPILGYYSPSNYNSYNLPPVFEVDSTSFNCYESDESLRLTTRGWLVNYNTIEEFKEKASKGRHEFLNSLCATNWSSNLDDTVRNVSNLNSFILITYANFKKFTYYYWFCFPCVPNQPKLLDTFPLACKFNDVKTTELHQKYLSLNKTDRPFFVVRKNNNSVDVIKFAVANISSDEEELKSVFFAYSDPCQSPNYPGWPLRNYIVFLLNKYPKLVGKRLQFLSFRLTNTTTCRNSLIYHVENDYVPKLEDWLGWEMVSSDKFGPRTVSLQYSMAPKMLAEASVDLNLKLMKWQLAPSLDLELIKNSKCLILGAGTLGCSVARTLIGWGVRHISVVDNKKVSYSNPARQSLFTFEDSQKNRSKSFAAVSQLKRIYPGISAKAYDFTIPMPGHPVGDSLINKTTEALNTLTTLISTHDIIFLLMDTRESRWLPTVLGNIYKKLVINAALGFDSYLVMRHGSRFKNEDINIDDLSNRAIPGNRLGCYFCNDITAPGNSTVGRTLDRQCTVTRPGVACIAGAIAVELAVSVLQHPLGINAPAFLQSQDNAENDDDENEEGHGILGAVPHSIRGYLWNYKQISLVAQKYEQCVACSDIIVRLVEANADEFFFNVFNSSNYLLEVTGLNKICTNVEDLNLDFDEDEDFEDTT